MVHVAAPPVRGSLRRRLARFLNMHASIEPCRMLDFTVEKYRVFLHWASSVYLEFRKNNNAPVLKNTSSGHHALDCAVIQTLHQLIRKELPPAIDAVRGLFEEGDPVYQGSRFRQKSHIQIAVVNPSCIKGYFLPKEYPL